MFRKTTNDIQFDRRVGELLRTVRVNSGVTQADLARGIGTSQSAISEIETATCGCTVWLLRRLAQGLGYELKITFERKSYETT